MVHIKKDKNIYADYASSTPIDPRVLSEYTKTLKKVFGNPSAFHHEGELARKMLSTARERIARLIDAHSDEIIFTSGGTESDNLAVIGTVLRQKEIHPEAKLHLIVSSIEHAAIIESAHYLKDIISVDYAPIDEQGILDIEALKKLLRDNTILVSIMQANNEIGTIQPIKEIAKTIRLYRKHRENNLPLYFHTDACQSFVYLPLRVEELGVDLLTLNSSKIYGPKGIGVLYKKRGVEIAPLLHGGVQEFGLRSGTENAALADAFALAAELNEHIKEKEKNRLKKIQALFIKELRKNIKNVIINGDEVERLPNNVNITIPGLSSEVIVLYLNSAGISVSEKSACKSGEAGASHVITALRKENSNATDGSIRFSFGRYTKEKHISIIIKELVRIIALNSSF